jgi:hypothetical protein
MKKVLKSLLAGLLVVVFIMVIAAIMLLDLIAFVVVSVLDLITGILRWLRECWKSFIKEFVLGLKKGKERK